MRAINRSKLGDIMIERLTALLAPSMDSPSRAIGSQATQRPVGPSGHWLWGNLQEFRAGILAFFERTRERHGTVVPFRLGTRKMVLISEPDCIEQVLVHQNRNFRKHWGVRLLAPVLGRGLLLSEGGFWLKQRRLMQPAFSQRLSELFADIVVRRAAELAEGRQRAGRNPLRVCEAG